MKTVLIIGEGILTDYVSKDLASQYQVILRSDFETDVPEKANLALVLDDGWNPSIHQKAEIIMREMKIPWIRGFTAFGEGIIGPLVRPSIPGCSQCADLRYLMAGRDRKEMWELRQQQLQGNQVKDRMGASNTGLLQTALIIQAEVQRIMTGGEAKLEGSVALINLKNLNVSWHSFLPDPVCPVCSQLVEDSSVRARILLQASPKIPGSFRSRSIKELSKFLTSDYLDQRMGLLNNKMIDLIPPFADASVNLPLFNGDEGAAGRTNSYAISEMTAVLEGLERYCGIEPRGKKTMIRDSYRNVKDYALDPKKIGVHSTEQYKQPDFPFKPFDPDAPIHWVWGYSFLQERSILIPELLAYYSLGCGEGFVYETSNGCALGGSLEEAILYGIFEVVERDSFLLTWYAELPLPRLDPYSTEDEELRVMIDRARAAGGYDIYLYNATMEHGIPSVWALAKNRKKKGLNIICAAGAHLDPIRAAKSAVHELAGMMLTLDEKFEGNQIKWEKMFHDSSQVQQMDDHGMLFGLKQTEERLQFLLDESRPLRTFDEEFTDIVNHSDLTNDLEDILQRFRQLNLDVVVVNQTTPELKRNDLHCVKVLIPGMLPMTFGHHLTRVKGLERVLQVPMELGYVNEALTIDQLNPHPHPFP